MPGIFLSRANTVRLSANLYFWICMNKILNNDERLFKISFNQIGKYATNINPLILDNIHYDSISI